MTEYRYFDFSELRYFPAIRTATGRILSFDMRSRLLNGGYTGGGFTEILARRCTTSALSNGRAIPGVVDHNSRDQFATTADGSLDLIEDDRGLLARIVLPDTELGNNIVRWLNERAITGCSFAMGDVTDSWRRDTYGLLRTVRTIGRLDDVSLLHNELPAYAVGTDAQLGESRDWIAADRVRQQHVADQNRLDALQLNRVARRAEYARVRERDLDRLRIVTLGRVA